MDSVFLFYGIIAILTLQFVVETVLDHLNFKRFNAPVPEELTDVFNTEEYQKSITYKQTNYWFGLASSGFSFAIMMAFLFLGGFEWVDQIARSITDLPIGIALLFFGIIMVGSDILSTPFAYYQTFVIEERFGFNKATPQLFFIDKIKGWLMTIVLGGLLLSLVMWFYQWAGTLFWIYAWGLITVFTVFYEFVLQSVNCSTL